MQKAVGTHLLIRIDRKLQRSRSIITESGLMAHPSYEHMQYNLQFGEILSVGELVNNPFVRVGWRAIIHHTVEADDQYLVSELENGDQVRWVNSVSLTYNFKLYGVIDNADKIIPLPEFVFCEPEPSEDLEYEEMKFGTERLRFSTEKVGDLFVAKLPKKEDEKKFLTTTIAYVAPTEKILRPGMEVMAQDFTRYPITLLGRDYVILAREFILSQDTV